MKLHLIDTARQIFADTEIVLLEGARDLGAAIGTAQYRSKYVKEKVNKWTSEVEQLCVIVESSPQAAHSAFIHGLRHR